jgi:gluconolactonase
MKTSTELLNRREFVSLSLAATAALAVPAQAGELGSITDRYPDSRIKTLDPRFGGLIIGNTPITRIDGGNLWAEGPAWNGVGHYLIWSDIPADSQRRWLEEDGHVSEFRKPSGKSNGNTYDFQGRQIACQHLHRRGGGGGHARAGTQRGVRYANDGSETVLADSFNGKPLNAPNDVVVHPNDGAIWFTDPGYGLNWYEGQPGEQLLKEAVYRIDATSGKIDLMTDEIFKPNGLCFSPDYKRLYVADTGASHYPEAPHEIKVWNIDGGKRLSGGRSFASMEMEGFDAGFADGIRADIQGNIWAGAGWVGEGYDGVHVFAPDGQRIGLIPLPEICANLCFGGTHRNRLFMAASQSVYSLYVNTQGAHIT